MHKVFIFSCALLALLAGSSFGQLDVSGKLTPSAMVRVSDGSLIDLPFRLGNLNLNYSLGDFELRTTSSIETRWQNPEFSVDMFELREAYLIWYPSFGELKLGKMIHAWGAADGNNPTDNLSPYDFYYMFMTGTARKLGTLSASLKLYAGDFQLELVGIPQFVENRIPYDEPDFPIKIELPPNAEVTLPENEFEFGGRLQYAMGLGDLSLSYFKGHDRLLSALGLKVDLAPGNPPVLTLKPELGYRATQVVGLDGVLFPGNWTVRGEFAYFQTQTDAGNLEATLFQTEANYLQSVLQLEYAFSNGLQLMGQLISTDNGDINTTMEPDSTFNLIPAQMRISLAPPAFQSGMGTPFALIADRVMVISSMIDLFDNSLELQGMLMANLEETGYMTNLSASYSLIEGLDLSAALAYFSGADEPGNSFKQLEDFSNVTLGLTYSF